MKIFLIGYMASGKTTFGKALAKETGLTFIDLDDAVIEDMEMSIPEIFDRFGENYFREKEREILHKVSGAENMIIACGGGTPCFFDNLDFMNSIGETVWMDASERVLLDRLLLDSDNRPLVRGKDKETLLATIRLQLEKRLPFYSGASIRFNADNLDDEESICHSVASFISRHIARK